MVKVEAYSSECEGVLGTFVKSRQRRAIWKLTCCVHATKRRYDQINFAS